MITDLFVKDGLGTSGLGSTSGDASALILSQTNESYLSLQLAGSNGNSGNGYGMGSNASFWTTTNEVSNGNAWCSIFFSTDYYSVYLGSASLWDYKYVRCVKD